MNLSRLRQSHLRVARFLDPESCSVSLYGLNCLNGLNVFLLDGCRFCDGRQPSWRAMINRSVSPSAAVQRQPGLLRTVYSKSACSCTESSGVSAKPRICCTRSVTQPHHALVIRYWGPL